MFVFALTVPETSIAYPVFDWLNKPVLWMLAWVRNRMNHPSLPLLLGTFLGYWIIVGSLVGLGCRLLGRRRPVARTVS